MAPVGTTTSNTNTNTNTNKVLAIMGVLVALSCTMILIQYDISFTVSVNKTAKQPLTITTGNQVRLPSPPQESYNEEGADVDVEVGDMNLNVNVDQNQYEDGGITVNNNDPTDTTTTANANVNTNANNENEPPLLPPTEPAEPTEPTEPAEPTAPIQNTETNMDTTNNESNSNTESKPNKYSILPKRIYSVIGLESSGTQFVTRLLSNALGQPNYREGSAEYAPYNEIHENDTQNDVQVQHFSLPWGSSCQDTPQVPILDAVLPSQCSRIDNTNPECAAMKQELWGSSPSNNFRNYVNYPTRYNLDIISQKETMTKWGVEQFFIIVLRDTNISFKARRGAHHCTIDHLAREEEQVGKDIIIDAINKYVLDSSDAGRKVTRENYNFWHGETFRVRRDRHLRHLRLNDNTNHDIHRNHDEQRKLAMESLPMGNNVVLVSYETLMLLKDPYVDVLYQSLGIESNHRPHIKDGNTKYVPSY